MSLSVKFSRNWEFWEDPDGNARRHVPAGLVLELPDDMAAAAIYDGAAEPTGEITPDVQGHLDAYAEMVKQLEGGASLDQAMANMATTLAAANSGASGEADPDADAGGEADPGASGEVPPTAPKAKAKAKANG